jgi:hypothetical protein
MNSLWVSTKPTGFHRNISRIRRFMYARMYPSSRNCCQVSWIVANFKTCFLFIDVSFFTSSAILPTLLDLYSRWAHLNMSLKHVSFPWKRKSIRCARYFHRWWNSAKSEENHVNTATHSLTFIDALGKICLKTETKKRHVIHAIR